LDIGDIEMKKLIVDGTMQNRPTPIGFWGYNHRAERQNEPWLEDVSLNEMITRTAQQKARAKSRNARTPAFVNHRHPRIVPENFQTAAAWVTERYKLVMPRTRGNRKQVPELYGLDKDREEKSNIASQHPDRVKTMLAALRAWQHSVENSLAGADY
jgi:hypothetical protein